jgi:Flp pilus assembly protein TadD
MAELAGPQAGSEAVAPSAAGPVDAKTLFQAAVNAQQAGRLGEAIALYARVLALTPDDSRCYNNIGVALRAQSRFAAALACYQQALGRTPNDPGLHSNIGNVLRSLGRFEEAETSHRQALALRPDHTEALYNLGLVLKDNQRFKEALQCLNEVIRRRPQHADAHFDRALVWLQTGDLLRGFAEYEWRWRLKENPPRKFERPLWDGAPLAGRTLLLYGEQGMGDVIQFARYASFAGETGRVIVECQPPLVRLMQSLHGVAAVVPRGATLPAFDLQAPLLSMPRIRGTTRESIPSPGRYLAPPEGAGAKLLPIIQGRKVALKVGIAWAGKPSHRNDHNRTAGLAPFIALLGVPNVAFFNLQVGDRARDLVSLGCHGLITDLAPLIEDFTDTAAAMDALDLVITVDTSVAHLAGALGRPVWILLSYSGEWRYLEGLTDSPWYPSARLFQQQSFGDWPGVFDAVRQTLAALATERAR